MLLLLRAVYPRAIVDQITVRGNGRENPVEIGLLVIVLSRIEKRCNFYVFYVIIFKAVVDESKVTLTAFICVFCFVIFIF